MDTGIGLADTAADASTAPRASSRTPATDHALRAMRLRPKGVIVRECRPAEGGLQPIASGQGHTGAVRLHQRDAVLWGGQLRPGEHVAIPHGPHAHVFVAVGTASIGPNEPLSKGDAARLTGVTNLELAAEDHGAEVLIWVTT